MPQPMKGKGSHKIAEQKRRDSLKTSFDDLRLLLPPIPLPTSDEQGVVPPGGHPPRGPPKGAGDGPNRGVSKLQLLRCGNEFIKTLKGRVERRDDEIENLRREVRRLRMGGVLAGVSEDDGVELDLERDLDEVEKTGRGVFGTAMVLNGDDGEEDLGE